MRLDTSDEGMLGIAPFLVVAIVKRLPRTSLDCDSWETPAFLCFMLQACFLFLGMQPALLAFKVPPRSLVVFWNVSFGVALARLDCNKGFVESWVLVYGTLFFLAFPCTCGFTANACSCLAKLY